VAAEDLLWNFTASWHLSGAYDLSIFSIIVLSLLHQVLTLKCLLQMQHLLLLPLCNNLFLGCYMATRPRRASCPRL